MRGGFRRGFVGYKARAVMRRIANQQRMYEQEMENLNREYEDLQKSIAELTQQIQALETYLNNRKGD